MIVDSPARLKRLRIRRRARSPDDPATRGDAASPQSDAHAPTADELFRKTRRQLPAVSHATVYRDLQELVRVRLLPTLERACSPVKYATPDDHHQFV
jgi:hypothetical protein